MQKFPQLGQDLFITEGGIETWMIYHEGFELPEFSAIVLCDSDRGIKLLKRYFLDYLRIAEKYSVGLQLDTPTWRASTDWGKKIGYNKEKLERLNKKAVDVLKSIKNDYNGKHLLIDGCIGPRSDAYRPENYMQIGEAKDYHLEQIKILKEAGVDMITAATMSYSNEAIGIVKAAQEIGINVAISFTVETNSRLPNGDTLESAINMVDYHTKGYPLYYLINCAHTSHFNDMLVQCSEENSKDRDISWLHRIRGCRCNASKQSHGELDNATSLDDGNPVEFAQELHALHGILSHINILGGCCGSDHRHIEEICKIFC